MPKISIFSSNYNREVFLPFTIESILSQSFTDFEYLIVDDGSTDNSVKIIEEYCKRDSRIKFWNRGRKGLTDQYNFLLQQVSSDTEYITWIDTDDIYVVDNLKRRLEIFSLYPDIMMVYNNLLHIDKYGEVFERNYPIKLENFYFNEYNSSREVAPMIHLLQYYNEIPLISFGSLIFRKELLSYIGINNPSKNPWYFIGDFDLFYRAIFSHKTYGLKDKILKYRVHSGQSITSRKKELSKDLNYIIRNFFYDGILSRKDYFKIISKSLNFIRFNI